MKHEEWIKRRKMEVLDRLATWLQIAVIGLGILGCVFVHPIFYIPIIIGVVMYNSIIYQCVNMVIHDIQIDLWNDRFEETMERMITLRR
jgi:hypothetical protein